MDARELLGAARSAAWSDVRLTLMIAWLAGCEDQPMQVSRSDVLRVVDALLSGELSREEASRWAGPLHVEEMDDPVVEEALDRLTLIDAVQTSAEAQQVGYLFDLATLEAVRRTLLHDD